MTPLGFLKKAVVVLVALLVVSSVVLGGLVASGVVTLQRPTVETVESSWGAVTADRTTIRTEVVVNNPNPVGVPGVLNVDYTASMNGVVLAKGGKSGIGLSKGRNVLALSANVSNDRIEEWWVAHVNDGERSTLKIRGTVSGPGGLSKQIERTRTVETNLLEGLGGEDSVVSVGGEKFLVLSDRSVRWGEATAEETPMIFSARVRNVHDHALELDGLEYVVRMNGVTLGNGTTTEGVSVAPGESSTVEVPAALDTSKISEWWVTHLRNGERTNLTVELYGYVEENGTRKRVPLSLFGRTMRFSTDILGDGQPTTELVSTTEQPNLTAPSVADTTRRWGEVTDATTPILTNVTVDNPNSQAMSDLLDLRVSQTVTINDVVVAEDVTTTDVPPGRSQFVHVAEMNNSKVPQWWARHINNGEQSTVVIDPNATADVGFTEFDVALDRSTSTFETDLLAGIEGNAGQRFEIRGQEVAVVHDTRAEWGDATPQRTPFTVSMKIENTGPTPLTISAVDYTITMNGIVVGNGTAPESHTVAPGDTEWVTFTFVIDSQRMDEWWVSHVRNGERTVVDVQASATISTGDRSKRVDLTGVSTNSTVTTDILGQTSGTADAEGLRDSTRHREPAGGNTHAELLLAAERPALGVARVV